MKKLLAILMCAVFALALCACDKDDKDDKKDNSSSAKSSTAETSSEAGDDNSDEDSSKADSGSNKSGGVDQYGMFEDSEFNNGCQDALAQRLYGIQKSSWAEYLKAYPDFIQKIYNKNFYSKEMQDKYITEMHGVYTLSLGENYTFKCKIKASKKEDRKSVKSFCDLHKIDEKTVEEACYVDYDVVASNGDEKVTKHFSGTCYKISGKWYTKEM